MPLEKIVAFTGTVILADRLLENGTVVCQGGKIAAVGAKEITLRITSWDQKGQLERLMKEVLPHVRVKAGV